tara:strand:- start:790 stop:1089 length:300 start_codon:yes stop_codon:yes gene_type:complete
MVEKKYVNGMIIKEKVFENGGKIQKTTIKVDDFIKMLKEEDDGSGWVNLVTARRQTPSDKGVTHYAYIDPWKPDSSKQNTGDTAKKKVAVTAPDDDLPF